MQKNENNIDLSDLVTKLRDSIKNNEANEISIEESSQKVDIDNNQEITAINNDFYNYLFEKPDFIKNVADNPDVTQEVLDREQKRFQKDQIIKIVKWIIGSQLFFMGIIIMCVVAYATINVEIFRVVDNTILSTITDLLKYYVTATLAEVIGMLFFIVKHLFS